jgi:hypothetical protein
MTHAELYRALEENPALAKRNEELARALRHPLSKPAVRHEPLGEKPGTQQVPARLQVRFTAYRSRFIDPDNCVPKYLLDCLRHCGAIPDDSLQHIEVCVRQAKAPAGHLQGTLIELIPIE